MLYWDSFPVWNKKDQVTTLLLFAYTYTEIPLFLFDLKYYMTVHSWKLHSDF